MVVEGTREGMEGGLAGARAGEVSALAGNASESVAQQLSLTMAQWMSDIRARQDHSLRPPGTVTVLPCLLVTIFSKTWLPDVCQHTG